MSWPFSQPAPSFDTGFVGVPQVAADVSLTQQYLMGVTVCNPTNAAIRFSLTDGAGQFIVNQKVVAAHDDFTTPYNFMPVNGLRWAADNSGLIAKVWGY